MIEFKGKAVRSLANDKMNDLYCPESRSWIKFFLSLCAIGICMILEIVVIVYLLIWMLELGS